MQHRGDIPLGCRGCIIESGVECKSCPAKKVKIVPPKLQDKK